MRVSGETLWCASLLALLGLLLVWTRLVGLDQSLQHDEVFAIRTYVVPGPSGTLFGEYEPNDHVLFNLLTWVTTLGVGRSEALYRLWSALPGIAAVGLLTVWCWRRLGPVTAVAFAFLAVTAPLHLELMKQARGYGLAALAAAVTLVAGDRFLRSQDTRSLATWAVAAFAGLYTHVAFALGLVGQVVVLGLRREARRKVALASAAIACAALIAYAPIIGQMVDDYFQYYGDRVTPAYAANGPDDESRPPLPWHSVVTGPGSLLAPVAELAFTGETRPQCEAACFASGERLLYALVLAALAIAGGVALWRREPSIVLLLAGPLLSAYLLGTVARAFVADRFVSYLLLNVAVLVAAALAWPLDRRVLPRGLRAAAAVALVVAGLAVTSRFVDLNNEWTALPFENPKGVATVVNGSDADRVLTNSTRSIILEHYLGDERVEALEPDALNAELCALREPTVYIEHPVGGAVPADRTCLLRARGSRVQVPQRGRGGRIDVWLLQP
jgi:hypothetical protein